MANLGTGAGNANQCRFCSTAFF